MGAGMADDHTGRDSDKFMLRLPDGMRDRLKAQAEANKRSMNAEIVARLERTLRHHTPDGLADPAAIEDMRSAANKLYEALAMARAEGGRVTLEVKVDGIADDDTAERIGGQAYDAIADGAGEDAD
jgi:hypothetical protein